MNASEQRTVMAGYSKVFGPNKGEGGRKEHRTEWVVMAPIPLLTNGSSFKVPTKKGGLIVTVQGAPYKSWTVPQSSAQALVADQWGMAVVTLPPRDTATVPAKRGPGRPRKNAETTLPDLVPMDRVQDLVAKAVAAALASVQPATVSTPSVATTTTTTSDPEDDAARARIAARAAKGITATTTTRGRKSSAK